MKDIQYSPLSSEVFHIPARDEIGTLDLRYSQQRSWIY